MPYRTDANPNPKPLPRIEHDWLSWLLGPRVSTHAKDKPPGQESCIGGSQWVFINRACGHKAKYRGSCMWAEGDMERCPECR